MISFPGNIRLILLITLCFLFESCTTSGKIIMQPGERIDFIRVEKSDRRMYLYSGVKLIKTYNISLGRNPLGNKVQEGDNRTPEGTYTIEEKISKGQYYKYLRISYPDKDDRKRASLQGVDPGCDIMIHGLPYGYGWLGKLHLLRDWTYGCIAVTNSEMDELYEIIETGTPIEIVP